MNGHNLGNASSVGNIMGMYAEVPGPPRIRWRSIVGGSSAWVAEGIVDYGEGPVNIVGIVELADGKVNAARFYFADPFDPPAGRARWSDTPSTNAVASAERRRGG